jgi:hypothetical protein
LRAIVQARMYLIICPASSVGLIHDHAKSQLGLAKILDGHVLLEYYNPLPQTFSSIQNLKLKAHMHLVTSNVTWMSQDMYQTHRLINMRNDSASIILEEFLDKEDEVEEEEEQVNYVDEKEMSLKALKIKSDFFYDDLIERVRLEFEEKKCLRKLSSVSQTEEVKKNCDFTGRMCGHILKNLKAFVNDNLDVNSIYECDEFKNILKRQVKIFFYLLANLNP